ncbi:hypothetical protein PPACK8108_LOCUS8384 [Phakopsora pachyrhizi]|uniref:Uncharacterized protein n=1 Tax=Phakopsora pachyrhizi TaxID=170000 RepID=A0AAV0AWK3_PHAPC|nr:hypothetical protein PPACK8108_LOCUS8384 [Phakopsora pachyrhizi]
MSNFKDSLDMAQYTDPIQCCLSLISTPSLHHVAIWSDLFICLRDGQLKQKIATAYHTRQNIILAVEDILKDLKSSFLINWVNSSSDPPPPPHNSQSAVGPLQCKAQRLARALNGDLLLE